TSPRRRRSSNRSASAISRATLGTRPAAAAGTVRNGPALSFIRPLAPAAKFTLQCTVNPGVMFFAFILMLPPHVLVPWPSTAAPSLLLRGPDLVIDLRQPRRVRRPRRRHQLPQRRGVAGQFPLHHLLLRLQVRDGLVVLLPHLPQRPLQHRRVLAHFPDLPHH